MIIPARRRQPQADYVLMTITIVMVVFGAAMMWSASAIIADLGEKTGSQYYFLQRQALWALLGIGVMAFFSRFNYNRLREWVWPSVFVLLLLLFVVLFMHPVHGSRRWIQLGPLNFQPGEFAKIVIILFLADYVDRKKSRVGTVLHGLILPWAVVGAALILIAAEPDIGTPALIFVVALLTFFIGGAHMIHVLGAAVCAAPALAYEIFRHDYRVQRLKSFLDPFNQKGGYQLSQSLLAVGSGGWLGKGLGRSQLKLLYLPAPHTDFIFPIICEELGFVGGAVVVWLFAWFLLRGLAAARNAPNLFGTLLAAGLTFMIVLQAYFNIAMSIGLLPTKGVPLPFFSYGGSGLIASLAAVGILLNISKQAEFQK
ncbi:MAG: putative lipid II flippase FtsW [Elusimicrobia bacterium]|nr:putative lipid II flippase FtsW [Elusimicrobiota bacterium]